jgi:PAS domain S-box-containing protein
MKIDVADLNKVSFGFALLDEKLAIVSINENLAAIFQRPREYLINMPIRHLIPQLEEHAFREKYRFQYLTMDSGQTLSVDVMRIAENGASCFLLFCQDHTKYDQILEQIAVSNKKRIITDRMLDLLYDGCYITDGVGTTLYVNDSFLKMSGLTREELLGKTVYAMLQDQQIPKSCTAKVIESGKPASMIINYVKGKSCLVTGAPVFIDGKLERVICTSRDLSELVALKDKLANFTSLTISLKHQLREIEVQRNNKYVAATRSKAMNSIHDKALKIAALDTPVLLLGETGVGKDFMVHIIHDVSAKSDESCFIKINCGAIPEALLESELFGYEPGAFTDASRHGKVGFFEMAHNGTLFLDEIGEMPIALQVKLLNVIQDRRFYRLGGTKIIQTNARIIAATNADLERLIREGKFRSDLYYRLNVINIMIPPLRHRKDDIIPLGMLFLEEFNAKYHKARYFDPEVLEFFLSYSWPGNIREMKNMIERLVIMTSQDCIALNSIREQITSSSEYTCSLEHQMLDQLEKRRQSRSGAASNHLSLKEMLRIQEAAIIKKQIEESATLKEAAKNLGIDLSTLVRKKQKLKLNS